VGPSYKDGLSVPVRVLRRSLDSRTSSARIDNEAGFFSGLQVSSADFLYLVRIQFALFNLNLIAGLSKGLRTFQYLVMPPKSLRPCLECFAFEIGRHVVFYGWMFERIMLWKCDCIKD
jgi:hypothetical protein